MSDHRVVRELLPLFALGALDGTDECEQVCAHLATGCASCAEELAAFARTAAALPSALPAAAPRAAVRETLEAKLKTVAPGSRRETVVPLRAGSAPPRAGVPRWAFAAAAGLAAVGLLFGATTWRELEREKELRWSSELRVSEQLVELEGLRRERDAAKSALAKLADPEVRVFELAAVGRESGGGRIVWDRETRTWTLHARGLAPLPEDRVYELWFIAGDTKIPAGRFRPDASGVVQHSIAIPEGLDRIDVGAVTREPANDPDPRNPSNELVIAGKTA